MLEVPLSENQHHGIPLLRVTYHIAYIEVKQRDPFAVEEIALEEPHEKGDKQQ